MPKNWSQRISAKSQSKEPTKTTINQGTVDCRSSLKFGRYLFNHGIRALQNHRKARSDLTRTKKSPQSLEETADNQINKNSKTIIVHICHYRRFCTFVNQR